MVCANSKVAQMSMPQSAKLICSAAAIGRSPSKLRPPQFVEFMKKLLAILSWSLQPNISPVVVRCDPHDFTKRPHCSRNVMREHDSILGHGGHVVSLRFHLTGAMQGSACGVCVSRTAPRVRHAASRLRLAHFLRSAPRMRGGVGAGAPTDRMGRPRPGSEPGPSPLLCHKAARREPGTCAGQSQSGAGKSARHLAPVLRRVVGGP